MDEAIRSGVRRYELGSTKKWQEWVNQQGTTFITRTWLFIMLTCIVHVWLYSWNSQLHGLYFSACLTGKEAVEFED